MDFGEALYLPMPVENLAFGAPDEQSVVEAIERLEPFLKGQGYLPLGGKLAILNATVEDASRVVDLLLRLTTQQQQDDRAREQLRDQVDKDRVALAHAQKKNETLEEGNKRLAVTVKELEGKMLALKHKAEEQERDLKQKLQSTTTRLNGYLYGGRDAGKRTAAAAGNVGPGGARRVAPAYDKYRDDPAEAAASIQKLEAEMGQLRQQNLRLQKELSVARKQLGTGHSGSSNMSGGGGSPHRDGRRADQLEGPSRSSGIDGASNLDMQSVRNALSSEFRRDSDVSADDGDVGRLQRLVRDLQMNVEHLQRTKQELQRQLDKASTERSELHKTLHSLRSKCASLEVERRNAEDRFQRAQRATAALLDPAAAEAQTAELRTKLLAAEREIHEANARADGLKQQLAVAEVDVEANQRHVEVLKRAVRVMPRGQQGLEQLDRLVAEELQPLHAKLRKATEELVQAKAELEREQAQARGAPAAVETAEAATGPSITESTSVPAPLVSATIPGPEESQLPTVRTEDLPLSPPAPLPMSPSGRFGGFATKPGVAADSPPMLVQPPPLHAFYNRTFASTMPAPHSDCMVPDAAPLVPATRTTDAGAAACGYGQPPRHPSGLQGGGGAGGTQPGTGTTGNASSPYMRRSVSAGVSYRMGDQYASAERQRARWQVNNSQAQHRFPSPIDIIMEQARNCSGGADATISIQVSSPNPEGPPGPPSRGSTP